MSKKEKKKIKIDALADKSAKEIIDKAKTKLKDTSKHPLWKRVLGGALLPLVYCLWTIDRFLHLFMPHADHYRFKRYMIAKNSLNLTFIRILIASVLYLLFKLIF